MYPKFTKPELTIIEKTLGKIAKNRVLDYVNTINTFKTYSKEKKLIKTNFYLNQLLPQFDSVINKKEDYWMTPKEFLTIGRGDCEDYVIIKYFTLIKLGFDKKKLFFTTVYENHTNGYHMVLSYFKNKNKSPLILDNLSFKILSLKERKDLRADFFINTKGVYRLSKTNVLIKVGKYNSNFQKLLKRVKHESKKKL
jgi:predicted transglutaminase-like cysteine proteinase